LLAGSSPLASPLLLRQSPDRGSAAKTPSFKLPEDSKQLSDSSSIHQTSTPSIANNSSSKRVVWNGEDVIRDSGDDSDDSLEELEDLVRLVRPLIPTKRVHIDPTLLPTTKDKSKVDVGEERRKSARFSGKKPSTWASSKASVKKTPPRFSLAALVKQSQELRASEARVAEINKRLAEDGNMSRTSNHSRLDVNETVLTSLLVTGRDDDGETNAKRTMQAIQRTEALDHVYVWHFFGEQSHPSHAKFPRQCLPQASWSGVLKGSSKRESAFRSGFVARIASRTSLPLELQQWMFDELCVETRVDLLQAYVQSLEASTKHSKQFVTAEELANLFARLGARVVALSPQTAIVPDRQLLKERISPISPNVRWVVDLLGRIAPSLSDDTKEFAIQLLIRTSFDGAVLASGHLRVQIEQALLALISSLSERDADNILHRISSTLFQTVNSPILRWRLVTSIPFTTHRTHLFRRRLAFAFALDNPRHLEATMSNEAMTAHAVLHLKSASVYKITQDTDYHVIAALLKTLDIGIDCGFSDLAFLPRGSPATLGVESVAAKELESNFNSHVDMLTTAFRDVESGIVAGGASHISRLEVKGTAQRAADRLHLAVRTRPAQAKDWYAKGSEESEDFMKRWIESGPVAGSERMDGHTDG
jgi:hypothetical protein